MNKLSQIFISILLLTVLVAIDIAWCEYKRAETITTSYLQALIQANKIIDRQIALNKSKQISIDEYNLVHKPYKNGIAISGGLVDTLSMALKIACKKIIYIKSTATFSKSEIILSQKKDNSLQNIPPSTRTNK